MVIQLRPGSTWSDGSRPVSATDLAQSLIERSDPTRRPTRRAGPTCSIASRSATRPASRSGSTTRPLKAGGWLLGPVGPAHAGIDGRVATSPKERMLVTDGLYRCIHSSRRRPRASTSATTGPPGASRRSEPRRCPRSAGSARSGCSSGLAAVTALRRGDVTMIDHVPPDQVASLAAGPGDPGRAGIASRSSTSSRWTAAIRHSATGPLRRGLSYAIDRKGLLEETVLKHPSNDAGRPR